MLSLWCKINLSSKGGVYVKNTEYKELYAEARVEVLLFKSEDVIATSDGSLNPDGTGDGGNVGSWTPLEW